MEEKHTHKNKYTKRIVIIVVSIIVAVCAIGVTGFWLANSQGNEGDSSQTITDTAEENSEVEADDNNNEPSEEGNNAGESGENAEQEVQVPEAIIDFVPEEAVVEVDESGTEDKWERVDAPAVR